MKASSAVSRNQLFQFVFFCVFASVTFHKTRLNLNGEEKIVLLRQRGRGDVSMPYNCKFEDPLLTPGDTVKWIVSAIISTDE